MARYQKATYPFFFLFVCCNAGNLTIRQKMTEDGLAEEPLTSLAFLAWCVCGVPVEPRRDEHTQGLKIWITRFSYLPT